MAIEGSQGLVTLTTPLALTVDKDKVRLELKNHYLQWNADSISTKEIQTIWDFVQIVYKAGFSDGASKAMNPTEQRQDRIAEIICEALNQKP
jgi:hypothetical protein